MYNRNPILNLIIWLLTGFGTFGARFRHENNLLRTTHADIINAVAEKEKLKLHLEQLKSELAVQKQDQMLLLNRERATWQLEREAELQRFQMEREADRTKFKLEREQAEMKEKFAIEEAEKRAQLKADETLTLKKLDFEQKIRQTDLDREKAILSIKEDYAKKETKLHQELHAEMYDKLNKALMSMTAEGDKNTKFVHELMLKIFDKAPALNTFENINRNYSGNQLPAASRTEVEVHS